MDTAEVMDSYCSYENLCMQPCMVWLLRYNLLRSNHTFLGNNNLCSYSGVSQMCEKFK